MAGGYFVFLLGIDLKKTEKKKLVPRLWSLYERHTLFSNRIHQRNNVEPVKALLSLSLCGQFHLAKEC